MPEMPQAFNDLLTLEECTAIDQTLLPTRDRIHWNHVLTSLLQQYAQTR
ncbi:hypothetical protein [Acaryochloris thomasi]|nr:hypothetical protein [Acaryochloris thomasi]